MLLLLGTRVRWDAALVVAALVSSCAWAAEEPLGDGEDPWLRLTREEWQPGRVDDNTSSHPMKDLECEGPQTQIEAAGASYTWQTVKEGLRRSLRTPLSQELFRTIVRIQQEEPDHCVLGITATSALLLPVTMPKFRNMARVLSSDQNFFVLNVSFYDVLRSGFPTFGITDRLSTAEYRAWFRTEEGFSFFPARAEHPACKGPVAQAMREALATGREQGWQETPVLLSVEFLGSGEASATACPLALAAALLVVALGRAEKGGGHTATLGVSSPQRESALHDVIELVSRAEELVRDYVDSEGVQFAEIIASDWNLLWLLQELQAVLPRMFPGGTWSRLEGGGHGEPLPGTARLEL